MTNHESPSDLHGFRRTEAGYFAALVPVLADSRECALETSSACSNGEAREALATKSHARGERSKLSGGRW